MSRVANILAAVKAKALEAASLHAERVMIGKIAPAAMKAGPYCCIVPDRQPSEWKDDEQLERRLEIKVGVLLRSDLAKADPDLQLVEAYEPIHAKIEELRHGSSAAGAVFDRMEEDKDGPQYDEEVKDFPVRFVLCRWTITFHRTAASPA